MVVHDVSQACVLRCATAWYDGTEGKIAQQRLGAPAQPARSLHPMKKSPSVPVVLFHYVSPDSGSLTPCTSVPMRIRALSQDAAARRDAAALQGGGGGAAGAAALRAHRPAGAAERRGANLLRRAQGGRKERSKQLCLGVERCISWLLRYACWRKLGDTRSKQAQWLQSAHVRRCASNALNVCNCCWHSCGWVWVRRGVAYDETDLPYHLYRRPAT